MTRGEQQTDAPVALSAKHGRGHWLILLIPYVWCVFAIPFLSGFDYVFGNVPFLLVWMCVGVLVAAGSVGWVYIVDRRRGDLEAI